MDREWMGRPHYGLRWWRDSENPEFVRFVMRKAWYDVRSGGRGRILCEGAMRVLPGDDELAVARAISAEVGAMLATR